LPTRYLARRYLARSPTGSSEVIEATDTARSSEPVAIKLLRTVGPHADIARAMFRREVEALRDLEHVAVVRILDAFESDHGLLGIALELVPGGATLADLLEDVRVGRTSLPALAWRVGMATHLLDGLLAAHARGVIHRDLKPGNVLWCRDDDTLRLADFGIAAVLALTARDPSGPTLRSFYSRPYAAPEQLLQRAPSFATDAYSFALLTTALLAGVAPGDDFEPRGLAALLQAPVAELRTSAVAEGDITTLCDTLSQSLLEDASARPSLLRLRDALARVGAALAPRLAAHLELTASARAKLRALGFVAEAHIASALSQDLRVRLDHTSQGDRIKVYGRALFAVVAVDEDCDGARALRVVDAGENPGPTHERHRACAEPCAVELRVGCGPSAALVDHAYAAERAASRRASKVLVDRAQLIIALERERLPAFVVDVLVDGEPVRADREARIGQASGYEGAMIEKVDVWGAFRMRVVAVTAASGATLANLVKQRLAPVNQEVQQLEAESDAEVDPPAEWYTLFDDLGDIEVLDLRQHIVGRVTGYDVDGGLLHVQTDKKRRLMRAQTFIVKNQMKERQLRQQERAIESLARGTCARPDMGLLLGEQAAHRMGEKPFVTLLQTGLAPAARVADLVDRILASESIFCLQGPPGTGKTTIIAEVVAQLLSADPRARVLVCSQANDAVANAIERIRKVRDGLAADWLVVRDVRLERVSLEGPWSGREAAYREFSTRVIRAAADGLAGRASSDPGRCAVGAWMESVEHEAHHVGRDYDELVQVWGTTTARADRPLRQLDGASYDLVVVDEAAKATVGEVLVPIVHARRVLLVGDHKQLPPFLEETTVEALGELRVTEEQAKYSLFEHLLALVPSAHRDMLETQFRMHPSICQVVSQLFYEGRLRSAPSTADRPLPAGAFDRAHHVMWVDFVGQDYVVGKTSRANDGECLLVVRLLDKLDRDCRRAGMALSVAVIAPYRGQVAALQRVVAEYAGRWSTLKVTAATVDAFQGREADVVMYSLVRTGSVERRFLADGRRFNVALSRARRLLIMVGDRDGARGTPRLVDLLALIPAENQVAAEGLAPVAEWQDSEAARRRATPPRPGKTSKKEVQ